MQKASRMILFLMLYWMQNHLLRTSARFTKLWRSLLSICSGISLVGARSERILMIQKAASLHTIWEISDVHPRFSNTDQRTVKSSRTTTATLSIAGRHARRVCSATSATQQLKGSIILTSIRESTVIEAVATSLRSVLSITINKRETMLRRCAKTIGNQFKIRSTI